MLALNLINKTKEYRERYIKLIFIMSILNLVSSCYQNLLYHESEFSGNNSMIIQTLSLYF